jgi:hypothetical protein
MVEIRQWGVCTQKHNRLEQQPFLLPTHPHLLRERSLVDTTMTTKSDSARKTSMAASQYRDPSSRVQTVPRTILASTTLETPVQLPLAQNRLVGATSGAGSSKRQDTDISMQSARSTRKIPRKNNQRRIANPSPLRADAFGGVAKIKSSSSTTALVASPTIGTKNTERDAAQNNTTKKKEMQALLAPVVLVKKSTNVNAVQTNNIREPSRSRSSVNGRCANTPDDHALVIQPNHPGRTIKPAPKKSGIRVMRAPPGTKWRATCASRPDHNKLTGGIVKKSSKYP